MKETIKQWIMAKLAFAGSVFVYKDDLLKMMNEDLDHISLSEVLDAFNELFFDDFIDCKCAGKVALARKYTMEYYDSSEKRYFIQNIMLCPYLKLAYYNQRRLNLWFKD